MTTDDRIRELEKIGNPHISKLTYGWVAYVTLPTPKGTSAEISSDFGHPTHESALTQLEARVYEINKDLAPLIDKA